MGRGIACTMVKKRTPRTSGALATRSPPVAAEASSAASSESAVEVSVVTKSAKAAKGNGALMAKAAG